MSDYLNAEPSAIGVIEVPKAIPTILLPKLCQQFKKSRLRALRENPEAFSSKFEAEVLFDDQIWADRLQNPLSKTFVAIRMNTPEVISETGNDVPARDLDFLISNDWLGMIVLLGPNILQSGVSAKGWRLFTSPNNNNNNISRLPDPALFRNSEVVYLAVSMFVLQEARRRGLGLELLRKSIQVVRKEALYSSAAKLNVSLFVEGNNIAAQELYKKAGFGHVLEEVSCELEGQVVMEKTFDLTSSPQ